MICSTRLLAEGVLARRRHGRQGTVLGPEDAEWKLVDSSAPVWGLRRFLRGRPDPDVAPGKWSRIASGLQRPAGRGNGVHAGVAVPCQDRIYDSGTLAESWLRADVGTIWCVLRCGRLPGGHDAVQPVRRFHRRVSSSRDVDAPRSDPSGLVWSHVRSESV